MSSRKISAFMNENQFLQCDFCNQPDQEAVFSESLGKSICINCRVQGGQNQGVVCIGLWNDYCMAQEQRLRCIQLSEIN